MGVVATNNRTWFEATPISLVDEDGCTVFVPVIKATLSILDGRLARDETQAELALEAVHTEDDPESSLRFESETAFVKPGTDVVLVGSARSANGPVESLDVGIKVGALSKVVKVFGDRYWLKQNGTIVATRPGKFERMPLVYERAFGGWDKADQDEANWRVEARNPVGVSFGDPLRFVQDGRIPMPNIEDPQHLIKRYGDTPPPAGFGFIAPHWQPRAQFAGTYDDQWDQNRKPLLPTDFDRRFFNAASPGLVAPRYLRGDEDVMIVNASPVAKLKFRLPGFPAPVCKIELRDGRTETLQTNLDTVIIDTDEMLVFLLWRNFVHLPKGPHEVVSMEVIPGNELRAAAAV